MCYPGPAKQDRSIKQLSSTGNECEARQESPQANIKRKINSMQVYDVIIIGGGHNGLTCAAYLGMAGLKVKVFERRELVGGACVTEEFFPGFRNSITAYTISLLHPKIIAELRLFAHGLKIVERRAQNFLPAPDGRYLLAAEGCTKRNVGEFSRADGERYDAFNRELDLAASLLRDLMLEAPPNLTRGLRFNSIRELTKAARLGNRIRHLSTQSLSGLFDLFTKSAGDYLDSWFEGELVKSLFGFDAIVGNYASPYTPGTAYVLLHHALGEVNGKKRTWGHALGGMGAITQALARAASSTPRQSQPTSVRSFSTRLLCRRALSMRAFCGVCAPGAAAPAPFA